MTLFDRFENRTVIQTVLAMETALAVGARLSLDPVGTDLPVMRRPDGLPFIPGSSIKGVVRAQTERILRSLQRSGLGACDPFDQPCVPPNKKESLLRRAEQAEQVDREFARLVFEESCTVCRLFGSPWFAGRLSFKDAHLANPDDLPVMTQIRDGVGIDRDLGAARAAIKYDFEVVVPGAQFDIEILAENLDDWELGLVLAVLNLWAEGDIAIGGKATRGPGWGRLGEMTLRRVERRGLVDYLMHGAMTEVQPDTFRAALAQKLAASREGE